MNNVTISPTTTCLNTLQITQIVEQYCLGCTVIVIPPPPPPPPVIYVPEPGTNTITVVQTPASPPPVRVMAYCMPHPVVRADGSTGNLIYLPVGEPQRDKPTGRSSRDLRSRCRDEVPDHDDRARDRAGVHVDRSRQLRRADLRLCLQPARAGAKSLCHSIRIDLGATITVPVASNVLASVVVEGEGVEEGEVGEDGQQGVEGASRR